MTTKTNVLFLLSASNLQAYSQNFPVQLDHAYHSQSHVNKFSGRQHFPLNIQLLFPMKPEKITENLAHEKDVLSSPISISVHSSSVIEFLIPLHVFHFYLCSSFLHCIYFLFFLFFFLPPFTCLNLWHYYVNCFCQLTLVKRSQTQIC